MAGFGLTKGTSRDDQLNSGAIPMANFDTCSASYAKYNFQLYEKQHLCFWSKGETPTLPQNEASKVKYAFGCLYFT